MNLRSRFNNQKFTHMVGMVFLVAALLTNRFLQPTPSFGDGPVDAIKGLLFGLAIGFMIWSVIQNQRARCARS